MNCSDFRDLLSERIAGELSPEQSREFDAHQDDCRACQDALRDWDQLTVLLRASWPSQDPPVPLFISPRKPPVSWVQLVRSWAATASLATVAACLLALVIFRPSIRFSGHELSVRFGATGAELGAVSPEAVNEAQVRAWVQSVLSQSPSPVRLEPSSKPDIGSSSEQQSGRVAQLGVQLEMIKENQASLWQQVQQHDLYLQSAWRGATQPIDQSPSTNQP